MICLHNTGMGKLLMYLRETKTMSMDSTGCQVCSLDEPQDFYGTRVLASIKIGESLIKHRL